MEITDHIRSAILSGKHAPGALLSQTELANAFGVSRIPIRDALLSLSAEKIVEVLPGKGARVVSLSQEGLVEIFDLRVMLECDLLSRAINRADAAAHAEAEYALRKSSLEAGRPGWHEGDWSFHRTLYQPAQRPRQLAIVRELRSSCAVYANGYASLASATDQWLIDHEGITRAFVEGRSDEACVILRRHILMAQRHLLAVVGEVQDIDTEAG